MCSSTAGNLVEDVLIDGVEDWALVVVEGQRGPGETQDAVDGLNHEATPDVVGLTKHLTRHAERRVGNLRESTRQSAYTEGVLAQEAFDFAGLVREVKGRSVCDIRAGLRAVETIL